MVLTKRLESAFKDSKPNLFRFAPSLVQLTIFGIASKEAKAQILIAFSVAAELDECSALKERKVEIQIVDLLRIEGTSVGLSALYAFILLCMKPREIRFRNAAIGFVDV